MIAESATTTYLVPEPFEQALLALRRVLAQANLPVTGELDMSRRLRESLLIGLTPLRVLFIAAPPWTFSRLAEAPGIVALTPLHVVVSARGSQTEIHFLRTVPTDLSPVDEPVMRAIHRLQDRITQAVERIGMRATLV
jgi:uncharacterized protein (DUF302 family)